MINHLNAHGNRRFSKTLSLVILMSFGLTPLPINAHLSESLKHSEAVKSPVASETPLPVPTPAPYTIAPASGAQGKEYEVMVTSNECLKDPTGTPVDKLTLYAPEGSGITIANLSASNCYLTAKLSIAPDAPFGISKLRLTRLDANKKPIVVYPLDFTVSGVTPQPIPPGLNNKGEVDVMWSVVPDKIVNHNFGRGVSKHFYAVEVVIGNDSGYDLQLSSVGFTVPALGGQYRIPNSGYRTVRGSLEAFGEVAPRKFAIMGLKMLGPILTGFLPFFHAANHKANFSSAINLISNPIEKGMENVWPDLLPTELDRLADQTYRDDVSTKTIIPNNVQARILTFVPKRIVCPNKKTCPSPDPQPRVPLDAKNDQDVMRALGQLVIVGQQIEHVNRVRVVSAPFGSSVTDHSVSGRIVDGCKQGLPGVQVTLSGGAGFVDRVMTTSHDGSYTFSNVPDGRTYTVTPSSGTIKFMPTLSPPFLLNDTRTNLDFSTDRLVIVGKVTNGNGEGVKKLKLDLIATGVTVGPVETMQDGSYRFELLAPGANSFTIKPESKAFTFKPAAVTWTCDQRDADIIATPTPVPSPTPTP